MACIVDLFDELGGTPEAGGRWFFNSPGPTDLLVGVCPTAATPQNGVVSGDQVGTGDSVCLDLTGMTPGTYNFTYVVPVSEDLSSCGEDCAGCAEIVITVEASPEDGAPVEFCSNDTSQQNLYGLLGNAPSVNGNWVCDNPGAWTTGQTNDNNGANDYFIPSSLGPGVYVFTYEINSDIECTNCTGSVEVTITEADMAGTDGTLLVCN